MPKNEVDRGDGGSTNEDASLSDVDFSSFLTGSSSLPGVDFRAASGINATAVAEAVIGIIAFAVGWAANSLVAAILSLPARVLEWVTESATDLFQATIGLGITAVEGVWSFSLAEFGLFAYPGALLVVLATFYVVDKGLDAAQEVL